MRGPSAAVVLGGVVNLAAFAGIKMGAKNQGGWLVGVAALGSIVLPGPHSPDDARDSVATSGTQLRVFASPDMARVQRVVGALNQAIASR